MIALDLARALKDAGLVWKPQIYDRFAIPDRDLDGMTFALSQIATRIEVLYGSPVVAFQGSSEWALDYILAQEVIWLPTESQLRQALEDRLDQEGFQTLRLTRFPDRYACEILTGVETVSFFGVSAEEAYARALLHVLGASHLTSQEIFYGQTG